VFLEKGILRQLQDRLDAKGDGQLVILNGLDDPESLSAHSEYAGGSMVDHFGILQFVNKTTGQWIPGVMQSSRGPSLISDIFF
jgi:hypothetical protein